MIRIGFKTVLTADGLNYITQVGVQLLEKKLQTLAVPDQSGDAGICSYLSHLLLSIPVLS